MKLKLFILGTYIVLPLVTIMMYRYEMLLFYPPFLVNAALLLRVSVGIFLFYLFMTQMILGSRAKWLERNVGLNHILKCHIFTTVFTLIFLSVHAYLRRGNGGLAEQTGILAGLTIVAVVVISAFFWIDTPLSKLPVIRELKAIIRERVKYHTFKKIHNIFGLTAIIVGIHIFQTSLVADQLRITLSIMYAYYGLSLLTYFNHKIAKPIILRKNYYEIVSVIQETVHASVDTKNIVTIQFKQHNNKALKYHAGQFAYIKFISGILSKTHGEHPFSFSSGADDAVISMTIQDEGDFTHRLMTDVKVGDRFTLDGPYGNFHLGHLRSNIPQDIIAIAGGIGITPYIGWLEEFTRNEMYHKHNINVLWLRREQDDQLTKKILAYNEYPNIDIQLLSQKKNKPLQESMLQELIQKSNKQICCYVCASVNIIKLATDMLLHVGVDKKKIYTEAFSV